MPDSTVTAKREQAEIVSLSRERATKFLDALASNPFIAVVVEGDQVRFYARADIDSEHLALIQETVDGLISEEGQ